jgi:hypothetical protein
MDDESMPAICCPALAQAMAAARYPLVELKPSGLVFTVGWNPPDDGGEGFEWVERPASHCPFCGNRVVGKHKEGAAVDGC